MPRLICFAHVPKSAGAYTTRYIIENVLPDYEHHQFGLPSKLFPATDTNVYFRTHYYTPPTTRGEADHDKIRENFKYCKQQGWFFFSFIRDPREQICSVYSEMQTILQNPNRKHPMSFKGDKPDDFIKRINYQGCYLPYYWEDYDFIAEFSKENLKYFFNKYFNHDYKERSPENISSNKGYKYFCEEGLISKETQTKIEESDQFKIYQEIINHNANFDLQF